MEQIKNSLYRILKNRYSDSEIQLLYNDIENCIFGKEIPKLSNINLDENDKKQILDEIDLIQNDCVERLISIDGYFSKEYKKWIYLLADDNPCIVYTCKKNGNSIDIINFLINITQQNENKVLDIFIELPFLYEYNKEYLSEKFTNNRIHYTWIDDENIKKFEKYKQIFLDKKYANMFILRNMESEVKNIISINIFHVFKLYKITKQFENIQNKELKEKFYNFFYKKLWEVKSNISELLSKKSDNFNEYYKISKQVFEQTIFYLSLHMDAYTIGRVFRSFDDYESKYIIIYTKFLNTNVLKNFLSELEFKQIVSSEYKSTDISKFTQSFFSDKNESELYDPEKDVEHLFENIEIVFGELIEKEFFI